MDDEEKAFTAMENVLTTLNSKYIALPASEVNRNNGVLKVVDQFIEKMCSLDILFKNLYRNKYYGGSFYDNLKINKPCEYDLDILLSLPKMLSPTVEVSDKPGFVHVSLKTLDMMEKKKDEAPKFQGLHNLLKDENICTDKVLIWIESLVTKAWNSCKTLKTQATEDQCSYTVNLKLVKAGPAITLKLACSNGEESFELDVDLVACFTFTTDQWPKQGYRPNTDKAKTSFFVVPKRPKGDSIDGTYWRLSFQEQERSLLTGKKIMKPTIKLIKKMRDRFNHKIASYFIKTVFLWEVQEPDYPALWDKPLSVALVRMLEKYEKFLRNGNIPYFWNKDFNLLEDLEPIITDGIANKIKKIVEHIKRDVQKDPFVIAQYLITKDEVDIVKNESPLGKKTLTKIKTNNQKLYMENATTLSSQSSSSSFEMVMDAVEAPRNCAVLNDSAPQIHSKLDDILAALKIQSLMIETLSNRVNQLTDENANLKLTIIGRLNNIEKKVDALSKEDSGMITVQLDALSLNENYLN